MAPLCLQDARSHHRIRSKCDVATSHLTDSGMRLVLAHLHTSACVVLPSSPAYLQIPIHSLRSSLAAPSGTQHTVQMTNLLVLFLQWTVQFSRTRAFSLAE